jgi:hypothetical protein
VRRRARIAALLAGCAAGCGTVLEYGEEVDFLATGDLDISAAGRNDCDVEAGDRLDAYTAEAIAAPELHIIGVDGARRRPGSPSGEARIRIERAGPSVVILSAYERTRWTIEPGDGAGIDKVIATGYGAQAVEAPAGMEVEVIDHATSGDMLGLAMTWPSEADRDGDCVDFFGPVLCELYGSSWRHELQRRIEEVDRLVERAEDRTGLTLSSFHGCRQMTAFTLVESQPRPRSAR